LTLEIGDSEVAVADIGEVALLPPGATSQTEGEHIVAVARFRDSVLASIAWRAIRDGLLTGTCAMIEHWQELGSVLVEGVLTAVRLGHSDDSCFANNRMLDTWTAPASSWPRHGSWPTGQTA
jgi:hypothetical protein